jgi:hypothetical protein
VSSRINLAFRPSVSTAVLAALPWLALALFVTATAWTRSLWLLLALVPIGWMAVSRARRLGWLSGRNAVHRIELDHERGRCWLGDGREISVRIHSSSLLTAAVLALKLDANGAMSGTLFTWVVGPIGPFPANADPQEIRRLRLWLRTGQSATVDSTR